MNADIVNPFVSAVTEVMPQLGFRDIKRGKLKLSERTVKCKGIAVIVGLTKELKGRIAYNMTTEAALKFASTMMMGITIDTLDELAQSAISEMINMVTANAAMHLEKGGIITDITPPIMILGNECTAELCSEKYLIMELFINSELIEVNIGLEG